jgi:hypothetical protein
VVAGLSWGDEVRRQGLEPRTVALRARNKRPRDLRRKLATSFYQVNPLPGLSAVDPCRSVFCAPNVPQQSVQVRSVAFPMLTRTSVR